MTLQTFSFKIDDALDPDVVAWLKASANRSIDIRKALRHYLDLPPRHEDTPATIPPQPGGVDQKTMNRLIGVLERLEKKLDVPQSIGRYSLNQAGDVDEEPEPEADPNLANATQAFLGMFG